MAEMPIIIKNVPVQFPVVSNFVTASDYYLLNPQSPPPSSTVPIYCTAPRQKRRQAGRTRLQYESPSQFGIWRSDSGPYRPRCSLMGGYKNSRDPEERKKDSHHFRHRPQVYPLSSNGSHRSEARLAILEVRRLPLSRM